MTSAVWLGRSWFELIGKLVSLGIFTLGLTVLDWSGINTLWGFWLEEVVILAFLYLRLPFLNRGDSHGTPERISLGPYLLFPAVHGVFIIAFTFMLADSDPGASALVGSLLNAIIPSPEIGNSGLLPLAQASGALVFWSMVEFLRDWKQKNITAQAVDIKARSTLILPHLSIIAGGFLLILMKTQDWLVWGLILGKFMAELLLFPKQRLNPTGNNPVPPVS